jgi:hypothetical protein
MSEALLRYVHEPVGKYRGPCPVCDKGPKDTACVVDVKPDGAALWWCHRCEGGGRVGRASDCVVRPTVRPAVPRSRARRWSDKAEAIWRRARELTRGDPVVRYLEARCCMRPPADADVRYLPASERHPWPCMLARITDAVTCEPLSLHFTYLNRDGTGKAPVDKPKRLLAGHVKKGGVIRLWPDDTVTYGLALAEGIETALTVAADFTPIWATVDAGNMAAFPVLDVIETLQVFADHDFGRGCKGETAARACAQRWADAGREAYVLLAPVPGGGDWNDIARGSQ